MNSGPVRTETQRAVTALVFITLLWGVSFPLVKMNNLLMEANQRQALSISDERAAELKLKLDLSAAAVTTTLRFGLALALLMLLFPRQFGQLTPRQWLMGAAAGFVFAIALIMQIVALSEIPASRSGFLTSLTVVFTPLLMVAVTRRRPALGVILAVGVSLIGVAILTGALLFDPVQILRPAENVTARIGVGDVLTMVSAAIFAVEIIMIDTFSRRMPPALLTPGMFAATLFTGAAVFAVEQVCWSEAPPVASWGNLFRTPGFPLLSLAICLVCTLVPFYYMNKYQAKVTPNHAALIYTLEPLFATLMAMLLPDIFSPLLGVKYASERLVVATPEGDRVNWELIVGGGLVIVANVLGLWSTSFPAEVSKTGNDSERS